MTYESNEVIKGSSGNSNSNKVPTTLRVVILIITLALLEAGFEAALVSLWGREKVSAWQPMPYLFFALIVSALGFVLWRRARKP